MPPRDRPPRQAARAAACAGTDPFLPLRLDQPIAAVAAAVEDVDLSGLVATEDEEVVADELELQRSLFRAHRLHGELLRPDDLGASLFIVGGNAHGTSGRNAVATCLPAPAL